MIFYSYKLPYYSLSLSLLKSVLAIIQILSLITIRPVKRFLRLRLSDVMYACPSSVPPSPRGRWSRTANPPLSRRRGRLLVVIRDVIRHQQQPSAGGEYGKLVGPLVPETDVASPEGWTKSLTIYGQ